MINQDIKMIKAEKALFSVRLNDSFNGNISLNYGLNQYAETFTGSYQQPNSRQSVSIGIQISIFQWGINKNRKQMAENTYRSILMNISKENEDFENEIVAMVNRYNHNVKLWFLSERAFQLSQEQYQMVVQKLSLGKVSAYELVVAQQEQSTTMQRYYNAIKEVWESYFTLRQMALYDFSKQEELMNLLTRNTKQ